LRIGEGGMKNMTNREFVKSDETFKVACELAKVRVTTRQASKWRNSKGAAFSKRVAAAQRMKEIN
jgi:hypothetical protein